MYASTKKNTAICLCKLQICFKEDSKFSYSYGRCKKQLADKSTTTPVPIPIQQSQYSDVLKKRCEEVIVIKPKDKTQDSSKTKKAVEEKINPAEIGVGVSRVKYVKEGGIAISCTKKKTLPTYLRI
ncbi:unnamed protein product [Acanthoscelides obtectus]|uniref:Uncharacterized protein n=1 Tax=Acanthoscelides obtectus TaxID=200917 RepID=A0A9P0LLU3_ACAOB|nr:unnamed protein product [Acanthoscelides obtectus]CAK1664060.1 hypothetical protein AOBTE_LOCUS24026 [Acanthoscelides obtectus]